ncbi:hypothetical protein K1719_027986 [Acacia pycnantha]|nr:hypothetical protein K1719_027986 [Acacia pycnantha]
MIQDLAEGENKEYFKKFWENFGRFLKLGCVEDSGNHKRIIPLLRLYTSECEEELKSLDDYIENMDIENLQTYKENKLFYISKEDLELGDEDEVKESETKQEYNLLFDWMKQQLGDKVAKVQVSKRLSSSPCVLVSGKFGWSANMERLLKAQTLGDTASLEFMRGRRILEVNPDHPIVKDLNAACKNAPDSSDAKRAVELLYERTLISSGFSPDSPAERGRSDKETGTEASIEADANANTNESFKAEVVEPSEVRHENDPWTTD